MRDLGAAALWALHLFLAVFLEAHLFRKRLLALRALEFICGHGILLLGFNNDAEASPTATSLPNQNPSFPDTLPHYSTLAGFARKQPPNCPVPSWSKCRSSALAEALKAGRHSVFPLGGA
ncbi:MAG: hypothetical protein NZ899_07225 [Thermoguttaceae bacterium]|nr:hypothetical protein [Thermoguttaceae bacterium]